MLTKNQIKDICIHLSNKDNKNVYVKEEEKPLYKAVSEDDTLLSRIEKAKAYDNLDVIWFVKGLKLVLMIKNYA